jgi:hypothetical protein
LTKNAGKEASPRQSAADGSFESNNVSRSKSLEGLLGDSPGVPKANLGYAPQPRQLRSPHNFMDSPKPVSVRGYQPPPPPLGVPPLDLRASVPSPGHRPSLGSPHEATEEDEAWAENLRRASLRQHRAASTPPSEDRIRGTAGQRPLQLQSRRHLCISSLLPGLQLGVRRALPWSHHFEIQQLRAHNGRRIF